MYNIIHKIDKLREGQKLSKSALAKRIGMTRENVYNLTDENIKLGILLRMCNILHIKPSSLFDENPHKIPQLVTEPDEVYQLEIIKHKIAYCKRTIQNYSTELENEFKEVERVELRIVETG